MNTPHDSTHDQERRAGNAAGEAAFQVLELILMRLIDRKIIEPDDLVAEIESLAEATPDDGWRPAASTVRGRLAVLANSLSAYTKRDE